MVEFGMMRESLLSQRVGERLLEQLTFVFSQIRKEIPSGRTWLTGSHAGLFKELLRAPAKYTRRIAYMYKIINK